MPRVSAFVERRCVDLGIGRQAALLLQLMAEELFINAVVHGYRSDGRRRVSLAIRDCGPEVELLAEDSARAFNPFDGAPVVPSAEQVGGYGRLLLIGLSSRQSYQRRGQRNCVTVGVRKNRP